MIRLALIFFVFLVAQFSVFAQTARFVVVNNGLWSSASTWNTAADGSGSSGVPLSGDDVRTNGRTVLIDGNYTVRRLLVEANTINGILYDNNQFDPFTITVTQFLAGYSASGATKPTVAVIGNSSDITFKFTGASNASSPSLVIRNWSTAAPINNLIFDPTGSTITTLETQLNTGDGISGGEFLVRNNIQVNGGFFKPNANIGQSGSATITVSSGSTLDLSAGNISGDAVTNSTKFNNIVISGTVTTTNTNYFNTDNITLNSNGVININASGANQTQGWWFQSTAPTGTISLNGIVNYGASANQSIYTLSYGNLNLGGSGTKSVTATGSVNISKDLTFANTGITFTSSQLVTFNGTVAQQISGGGTANFNGGLAINKTGIFTVNQDINLTGTLDIIAGSYSTSTTGSATLFINGTSAIAGSPSLNSLTINSGATLTAPASPSVISVFKDFTNNSSSSAFASGNGTVQFNGASAVQSITGSASTTFNNISVTNTTNPVSVQVQSSQNLKGVLTLSASSVFDADGSSNASIFTLLSSADNATIDASIAALPTGASVSGNVTVQRFMSIEGPNNTRIYRYISSPVQNAQALDIQNEIPITGAFTGSSSCSGCGTNQSMFSYNEAVITGGIDGGYVNFPAATNTETLFSGLGYAIYERGNVIPSGLWDVRGPINSGNLILGGALGVTFTSSGVPSDDGWNLVGNPYPSTIDWNASGWTKTNLNGTIYMRDNATGTIASFNGAIGTNGGSRYIATGQAFFVQASSANPSLAVSESAKAAGTQTTFFREEAPTNLIRVTMKKDAVSDELVVHFRKDASSEFDSQMDARKLKNATFNFSSVTEANSKLAINSLPLLGCSSEVKLDVSDAVSGGYQLSFSEFESFPTGVKISLLDKISNTTQDIRANSSYSFSVDQNNASTFGSDRFVLHFSYVSASIEMNSVEACLGSDAILTLKNSQPDLTYSFLSNGVQLVDALNGSGSDVILKIPSGKLKEGINTIDVKATSSTCSSISAATSIQVKSVSAPSVSTIITMNGQSCREGSITLNALGASTDGSYRWYDTKDSPNAIENATVSTYFTPVLSSTKSYYVSVLSALGCESGRKEIVAEVVKYADAVIQQLDNTTLTSNFAKGNQWYKDGKMIAGATNQQFKIDDTGIYKVEVKIGNCSTSTEGPYVVTGIESIDNEAVFSVFPNPTTGIVQVSVKANTSPKVDIQNSLGQSLAKIEMKKEGLQYKGSYDLGSNSNGLYFVRIIDETTGIQTVKKVIKN